MRTENEEARPRLFRDKSGGQPKLTAVSISVNLSYFRRQAFCASEATRSGLMNGYFSPLFT